MQRLEREIAELLDHIDLLTQQASPGIRQSEVGGHPERLRSDAAFAVVRLRWHEQNQAYGSRWLKEGRSNAEYMRCLKRFIARDVFHTLLGRPWVRPAVACMSRPLQSLATTHRSARGDDLYTSIRG